MTGELPDAPAPVWHDESLLPVWRAPLSCLLLVLNLALCLGPWAGHRLGLAGLGNPEAYRDWVLRWALRPEVAFGEWWRLLSAGFVHAPLLEPVDLLHVVTNSIFLVFLGPLLERRLGPWRFAVGYLACLLGGSLLGLACGDELPGSLGASGALFGLIGILFGLVVPHRAVLAAHLYEAYRFFFIVFFVLNVASMALLEPFAGVRIAHAGHLGGLAVGVGLGWAFAPGLLGVGRPGRRWALVLLLVVLPLVGFAAQRVARYRALFPRQPVDFHDYWQIEEPVHYDTHRDGGGDHGHA